MILKRLTHLIEQHNENRLRHFTEGQCAHRGNRHQEVFIEHLPTGNIFHCTKQNIIAKYKICHQEQPCFQQTFLPENSTDKQHQPQAKTQEERLTKDFFIAMFMVVMVMTATGGTAAASSVTGFFFLLKQHVHMGFKTMDSIRDGLLQSFFRQPLLIFHSQFLFHQINRNFFCFLYFGKDFLDFPCTVGTGQSFQHYLHFLHGFTSFTFSYEQPFIYSAKIRAVQNSP